VDKAIISCKGLDARKGLTDSSEDDAEIKKSMVSCSKKLIIAADSTKFGTISFAKVVDFRKGDILVTDALPDDTWAERLTDIGVIVVTEDS
jgi:DeoR/GlpR family transcriptional regulator of sugar metabolism